MTVTSEEEDNDNNPIDELREELERKIPLMKRTLQAGGNIMPALLRPSHRVIVGGEEKREKWEKLKEKQNREIEREMMLKRRRKAEERPALNDKWHTSLEERRKTDENDSTPKTAQQGTRRNKNQRRRCEASQTKRFHTATNRTKIVLWCEGDTG